MNKPNPKVLDIENIFRRQRKIQVNGEVHTVGEILDNSELKQYFVEQNPIEASRFYDIYEDKELGTMFAKTYDGHSEHGAQAFHIARDVGLDLLSIEPYSEVKANAYKINPSDDRINRHREISDGVLQRRTCV